MSRPFATAFYKSRSWEQARSAYMAMPVRRHFGTCPPYMCEECFDAGRVRPAKVVHHKVRLTPDNIGDPRVALAFENLERVCQDCHAELHSRSSSCRCAFGPNGEVMPK